MSAEKFGSVLKLEWVQENDGVDPGVTAFDKDRLEEDALMRIRPMVSEGFRNGEFKAVLDHCERGVQKTFSGSWSYKPLEVPKKVELPFGISIALGEDGTCGGMSSELAKQFADENGYIDEKGESAADAIESFLIALACSGVDLSQKQIASALETAVDCIGQNMD